MSDRIISGDAQLAEGSDRALRPQTLSEFVGQKAAKANAGLTCRPQRPRAVRLRRLAPASNGSRC